MAKIKKIIEWALSNRWFTAIFPGILLAYYTTLDIWGDDWYWVSKYKNIHSAIYIFLMLATFITIILKSVYEYKNDMRKKENELVLKKFISLIRSIVNTKKNRFYEKATRLKSEAKRVNFFTEITHPQEQIKFIMDQLRDFFEFWGVNRHQLAITILQCVIKENSNNEKWRFILKLDEQRKHTDPNVLMASESLARKAIDSGQPIFLADLEEGIERNCFLQSTRSEETGNTGSIYCKPVTIRIQDVTYKYVFSVVSYGTYLCQPDDILEANQMSMILDEIGDRVELELYLSAMRHHKSKS